MTTNPPGGPIRRRPRMCQLNVTFPVDLIDRIDEQAEARRISRAEALRRLLTYALDVPDALDEQVPGQLPLGGST